MAIKDMARQDVVTVTPGTSAVAVGRTMVDENVGSVVVVEDGEPAGIVTDRDLAAKVVAEDADPAAHTAADLMVEDLFTVPETEGIYDVLEAMKDAGVRRVPLIDGDGGLTGIVTLDDFLVLLSSEFENVSGVVQSESPPY